MRQNAILVARGAKNPAGVRRGRQPPRAGQKSENDHQNREYLLLKLKEVVAIFGQFAADLRRIFG